MIAWPQCIIDCKGYRVEKKKENDKIESLMTIHSLLWQIKHQKFIIKKF